MAAHADLILTNARAITLDQAQPCAEAVAVAGEKILAVGRYQDIGNLRKPHTQVIDCRGLTLIPGLIDAHCHLLATASALAGLDCGPASVSSIADLQGLLSRRAGETRPGNWIRGFGLEPSSLTEGRYPTRWELDSAAPRHPVRLEHGSGHAAVLNSQGLALAGIDAATVEPPEGIIHRDEATGEPDGRLLELSGWLRARLGNTRSDQEFAESIARLNRRLLSYGITSVHDAGPGNSPAHWQTFQTLIQAGQFLPRVMLMAGAGWLADFAAAGLAWGAGDDRLRLGHAKIMLTLTTGALQPGPAELGELVAQAHRGGFPVAIHAVEQEAIAAVAGLKELAAPWLDASEPGIPAGESGPRFSPRRRDRIEHCAECPPELVARLRRSGPISGPIVVTQPGFIHWRGDGYLERVGSELLPYLYPLAALSRSSIPLAFSSDAPVIDPSPWPAIYSAVTRRTAAGNSLPGGGVGTETDGPDAAGLAGLTVLDALRAYTRGGAIAEGAESRKGAIRPGMLADLVLVNRNLTGRETDAETERVKDTEALLTILGGQVVWDAGVGV